MTGQYLHTAWLNMRRSPWLTALTVFAIAVGIGCSMTTYALLHAVSGDARSGKSAQLFTPWLDRGGRREETGTFSPVARPLLSYKDAMALRNSSPARRQAVLFPARYSVATGASAKRPGPVAAVATHTDLFAMLNLHFLAGRPWSAADDASGAQVAVLTLSLARRLFADAGAVGRSLSIDGYSYKVVGVVDDWQWQSRYRSPSSSAADGSGLFGDGLPTEIFVPVETAASQLGEIRPTSGSYSCNGAGHRAYAGLNTRQGWLSSECAWTHLWVELAGFEQIERYTGFLRRYTGRQVSSGRFDDSAQGRLLALNEWQVVVDVVPAQLRVSALAASGFLLVCLINAMGMMFARFHARGAEMLLRRALGASRGALFRQCLAEAALLGVAGGLLGMALVAAGSGGLRMLLPPELAASVRIDAAVAAVGLLLSLVGTVCAGLYPAWRISRLHGTRPRPDAHHHRLGTVLVAAQLALTLAIAANALHMVSNAIQSMRYPSGFAEGDLFTFSWVSQKPLAELSVDVGADLAALRSTPAVLDATRSSHVPFSHEGYADVSGWLPGARLLGGLRMISEEPAAVYFVDDHAFNTLGLKLSEGRWFTREESGSPPDADSFLLSYAVVDQGLARAMYPGESAPGRWISSGGRDAHKITGVVEDLRSVAQHHMFASAMFFVDGTVYYIVRARPGQLQAAMRDAAARLRALDPARVVTGPAPFAAHRAIAQRGTKVWIGLLLLACALLAAVVALGIVGLTWYWTLQRRLQIGIRRALGARRSDILLRLMAGNLVMAAGAVGVGVVLAVAGNQWLVKHYGIPRLHLMAVASGALLVVLLSQLAVFWPALRAALIPPVVVTRTE